MSNLNNKIKELINTIKVKDFSSLSFENYNEDKQQFWKSFLSFLKNENLDSNLNHYFVRDNDDIDNGDDTSSIFGRIDELADLDDEALESLLSDTFGINGQNINLNNPSGTVGSNYFWNESVSHALALWLSRINPSTMALMEQDEDDYTSGQIKTRGASFKIKDIKKANAARNFNNLGALIADESKWVKPWFNIDRKSYAEVRGTDSIEGVLTNGKKLDFTRNYESDWIRLIMPEYGRAVEIEDLDRNFWVIGQVITAISAYLFDDNGPVPKVFKALLEEVVQLWENVLYLWALFIVITREPFYTAVHKEYVVLSNSEIQPYVKFDNFSDENVYPNINNTKSENNIILNNIWKRLKYIVDQYPQCNICIVPEIRYNNYEHNLYSWVSIPGMFLFDRNEAMRQGKSGDTIDEIDDISGLYNTVSSEHPVVKFIGFKGGQNANNYSIGKEDESLFGNRLYAYTKNTKDNNDRYSYYYPFSKITVKKELDPMTFYAGVRIIPEINIAYRRENENSIYGEFYSNAGESVNFKYIFKIKMYDAVRQMIKNDDDSNTSFWTIGWKMDGEGRGFGPRSSFSEGYGYGDPLSPPQDTMSISESSLKRGIYFGELLSNFNRNPELTFAIDIQDIPFEPLGGPGYVLSSKATQEEWENYNPQKDGGLYSRVSSDSVYMKNLKDANKSMLGKYINKYRNTEDWKSKMDQPDQPEPLKIVIGKRKSNLNLSDSAADPTLWREEFSSSNGGTDSGGIFSDSMRSAFKEVMGKTLSKYWTTSNSDTIRYVGDYYQGHYFDPTYTLEHNPRIDFLNPLYADYFLNGYVYEGNDFSTMQDIKNLKQKTETYLIGHYTKNANGNFDQSDNVEASYKEQSTSPHKRYNCITSHYGSGDSYIALRFGFDYDSPNYKEISTLRLCPYRYNTYNQETFNVAKIYAPALITKNEDGTGSYPNYRHLNIGLPLYGENERKDSIIDNLAAGAFTPKTDTDDYSIGTYGRRVWSNSYTYIFKRNIDDGTLPKWFIMYVQQYSTRRPILNSFLGSYKFNGDTEADGKKKYIDRISDDFYKTNATNILNSNYTDKDKVAELKRRGITIISLAAPKETDTTYVGGSDNSIIYRDAGYTTFKKHGSDTVNKIDRFWKDTYVSPMLARYFAIRKEVNNIVDKIGVISGKNNVDYSLLNIKSKVSNTDFKALMRTAVVQTEARFNGNIYLAKKYTFDKDTLKFSSTGNHTYRPKWQSYRGKQKVADYLQKISESYGSQNKELDSKAYGEQENKFTILKDLMNLTVTDLLCLDDDLNSQLNWYRLNSDKSYTESNASTYGGILANYWGIIHNGEIQTTDIPIGYKANKNATSYQREEKDLENILKDIFENFYDHDFISDDGVHKYEGDSNTYKGYRGHYIINNNDKVAFVSDRGNPSNATKCPILCNGKRFNGIDIQLDYQYTKFWWHCSAINDNSTAIDRRDMKFPAFIKIQNTGYSLSQAKGDGNNSRFKGWLEEMRRLGPKGIPQSGESLILNGPMNLDTTSTKFPSGVGDSVTTFNTYASKNFDYSNVSNVIKNSQNPQDPIYKDTDIYLVKSDFTECKLISFSFKAHQDISDSLNSNGLGLPTMNAGTITFGEDLPPLTTQTRITFFLPPNNKGSGTSYSEKFFIISDEYNLLKGNNLQSTWPEFATGDRIKNDEKQTYQFTGESGDDFMDYASLVNNCGTINAPNDKEYIRIDNNKYYLDFFHYPITGGGGKSGHIPNN